MDNKDVIICVNEIINNSQADSILNDFDQWELAYSFSHAMTEYYEQFKLPLDVSHC